VTETTGSIAAEDMAGAGNLILDWNTLLGAAVGALLVFLFTEVREYRQRRRERIGLLKLLLAEIDYNHQQFAKINIESELLARKTIPVAREAWVECRTKIAQLVDSRTFGDLENYYRKCQEIGGILLTATSPQVFPKTIEEADAKIKELERQAVIVRKAMQKYIRVPP
jgi:hypothetical protein